MKPVGEPDAGNPHVRFDERMGNGALPHGLSYRAHPRLYRTRSTDVRHQCRITEVKQTQCGRADNRRC